MVAVIGSTNIDTVIRVSRFPVTGETLKASSVNRFLGGKGANQAVSVARLGSKCLFVTALGDDSEGQMAEEILSKEGVFPRIFRSESHTGEAFIEVDDDGQNRILVHGGANDDLSVKFISSITELIMEASVILLQGEIPPETNEFIVNRFSSSVPIIVDPAPAHESMMNYARKVAFLTPNESEFEELSGYRVRSDFDELLLMAKRFQKTIGTNLILKMGSRGCCLITDEDTLHVPAFAPSKAVDTTGAGDAFNGAFSNALDKGKNIYDALCLAVAASGICVTRHGAVSSLPYPDETVRAVERIGDGAIGRERIASHRIQDNSKSRNQL